MAANDENRRNEYAFSDPSAVPTRNSAEPELLPGSALSANVDDDEFNVGSTITGNTRPGSDNHTESTVNTNAGPPSTVVRLYPTACDVARRPAFESHITPGGTLARTTPAPSTNDTEPSDPTRAVNPSRRNGKTHEVATFFECRTSDSS